MNKILVTGSSGFLGNSICKELGIDNVVYTLSRSNSTYNYDLINNIPIFNENFDIVIHAAGLAHFIPKTEYEKKSFYNSNILITENLLKALKKSTIKNFIFISSVSVYGLPTGNMISETQPLIATDPYGKSKIYSEFLISSWCKIHNVKLTILRLPLLVGENAPGNLASMIKGIKYGYYFNIANGKAKKSMVMVSDVSKILMTVSEIGGIYNLTDTHHPSFFELSQSISKQLNKKRIFNIPLFIAKIIANIGDLFGNWFPLNNTKLSKLTSSLTFDDSKAKYAFNWNPRKVIDVIKIK